MKYDKRIKNWQRHNLIGLDEKLKEAFPTKDTMPMIITGTIVEDRTGKFPKGFHTRTSLVTDIDLENGNFKTMNSVYILEGEEGDDMVGGDLGNAVIHISY